MRPARIAGITQSGYDREESNIWCAGLKMWENIRKARESRQEAVVT